MSMIKAQQAAKRVPSEEMLSDVADFGGFEAYPDDLVFKPSRPTFEMIEGSRKLQVMIGKPGIEFRVLELKSVPWRPGLQRVNAHDEKGALPSIVHVQWLPASEMGRVEREILFTVSKRKMNSIVAGRLIATLFFRHFVEPMDGSSWVATYFPGNWARWKEKVEARQVLDRMADTEV